MLKSLLIFCIFILSHLALAAPRVVEIGVASNFSEISSSTSNPYGNYFRQGIELAIADNQVALKKKNIVIKLQEFDYGTSQMKVVEVAERACKSNVALVLGYVYSSDALLAAPIHQSCKLPMFSPSATANRLSDFDSFVHLGSFDNKFQGKVLAQIAHKKLKAKKALMVFSSDCAYCTDLASAFETEFESGGGNAVSRIAILNTDTDFSGVADKIKSLDPDVILVPNHELLSARIIAALVDKGIKKPFLGGDGWGNNGDQFTKTLNGRKIDGYSVSHWFPENPAPKSKAFMAKYQKRFGKMPNDTAVLSYDSMSIVIKALLDSQNLERPSIEVALQKIKSFEGVTGKFDYSRSPAPKKDLVLLKADPDMYRFVKVVKAE